MRDRLRLDEITLLSLGDLFCTFLLMFLPSGAGAVFVAQSRRQFIVIDRFCLAKESNGREFRRTERWERNVGYKTSTVSYGGDRWPPTKDCNWSAFCTPSRSALKSKRPVHLYFALIYENQFRLLELRNLLTYKSCIFSRLDWSVVHFCMPKIKRPPRKAIQSYNLCRGARCNCGCFVLKYGFLRAKKGRITFEIW
jgi:hypothetical protein